jgi:peptidoglycan/LPS O-acetylase OafA/YrhL
MNYFNYINLIRHIAAISVIYVHSFELMSSTDIDYINKLFSIDLGFVAVNVFFFLSGVLIYKSALNSSTVMNYIKKRFLRIYPALFICVLISTLFFWIISSVDFLSYFSNNVTIDFLANLLFIGNYSAYAIFDLNYYPNVANGSLWTLRYEIVMYLITSIFVFSYFRKRQYVLYMIFFLFFIIYIFTFNEPKTMYTNLARLGSYFFIGAILSNINILIYKNYIYLTSFILFIFLMIFNVNHELVIFLLIVFILKYSLDYIYYNNENSKKLDFDISYGLYIYAFPIQQILIKYIEFDNVYLYFISSLFLTIIFAIFSWFIIEKKALKLKYESK